MKKLISLIISASIIMQVLTPLAGVVTYAQDNKLKWERNAYLDDKLVKMDGKGKADEALVSWDLEDGETLDYFVETSNSDVNKVEFTFNRNGNDEPASASIQVLGEDSNPRELTYSEFSYHTDPGRWSEGKQGKKFELKDIRSGSTYTGGRVQIKELGMEIRFRWESSKIYFQTSQIKNGNITPFNLKKEDVEQGTINILTGIGGFKVSPVHIEIDDSNKITNKNRIIVPGDGEAPGSKPGIKVEFKELKELNNNKNEFVPLGNKAEKIKATLDFKLNNQDTARLNFNLKNGSPITDPPQDQVGQKKLAYENGVYSLYLAQEDEGHDNIIKWDKLDKSMILEKVELSLADSNSTPETDLGRFEPEQYGHTYLGYTIRRSSMSEAYMEIQPYSALTSTVFTYTVESSPNGTSWGEVVSHKHTTTGKYNEDPFRIPVPFSSGVKDQYYRVKISYGKDKKTINSQEINYKPQEDDTIPPPTPVIKSIDNIYAVPPLKLGDQPEAIGFDLTWSAPKEELLRELLNKGSIYYELFLHDDLELIDEKGDLIKVFKVSLENGNIIVDTHAGTSGSTTPAAIRYNPGKETFTMEKVVLKKTRIDQWEKIEITDDNKDYDNGKATEYPSFGGKDTMLAKEVPGIYYMTMRAFYESDPGDDGKRAPMGISPTSGPKSITISPLEEVIPVSTRIESKHSPVEDDKDIIRQSFSWNNVNLDRYKKQMLDPLDLAIGGKGKGVYELYLYQKVDGKKIDEKDLEKIMPVAENLEDEFYDLKDKDIENLRKGEIIRLDYNGLSNQGMNTILLNNLDPNQVYYMSIRVRLDIKDKDDKDPEPRYSVLSKEHSFTTYTKPDEPSPGERVPPVPEDLELIEQPNNTTAKIGWKAPEYTMQEGEKLYYEMLRIDSRVMAKEEDSRLFEIEKLIKDDKKDELHGWRTKNTLVEEYKKISDKWVEASPQQASNKLQLEDDKLKPNEIYYYYVRTVLVVDGEEVYSSWVGIPVTTDPIQKPINLKVEHKDDYSHDTKREIVVSFLAPIPKGASVPGDYDFDIAVQGELDDGYRLDYPVTRLTSKEDNENIPTGYQHFVYKIRNLKPGKRYDIKVRTIDKTMDMVNDQYPKSLYSGRVTTRTEFDQDEQDKDDKFAEYLKYFEDKVEALRRKPYWTLEDSRGNFAVKYRSNYINSQIASSKSYGLVTKAETADLTYYMPASVITNSNLSKTSLEIKQGNMTYSVRPYTITSELEELKEVLKEIEEKRIDDYYISFSFSQRPNSSIGDILTADIIVGAELVRLKDDDIFIDDDIMIALNKEIERETAHYIDDLEKALDRGRILDEDLDIIVNRSIEEIERRHQREAKRIVDRASSKIISIDKWKNSMLIMATIDGRASATGYKKGRIDEALTTFNIGTGYGIEVNEPGIYVFKGQKINVPVIPEIGDTGDLIVKYQLTDFFGVNGNINPNATVSKRNVLGAMARVLGAPRGADYNQYLKQQGIKGINNIAMDLPLKKGEGIYLVMQVYEKVHKRPISSVHIKNRNAVPNLQQFNQMHRPYVLVAVDSKFISQGSGIGPNDHIQTKDVLQMLDNIMKVIR